MPRGSEDVITAPRDSLPSYTQDVSPPLYAVDSDEEDLDFVPSFYNSYFSYAERRSQVSLRHDRDIELGVMGHELTLDRDHFLRRMSASSLSAREQYEFTDTGRTDTYGVDRSSTPRRSVSGTSRPDHDEEAPNPSRGARGWNHSWATPVSQSPPDYNLSQIQAARVAPSPASTASPTPDPSTASSSAQRTPDVSLLSTPEIPLSACRIPPQWSNIREMRSITPGVSSVYMHNTHIPVTEPPSPSSRLARPVTNPFLDASSGTPSPQIAPALTRESTRLSQRATRIAALSPVSTFGPLQPRRTTATTTARRNRGTKKPGWKFTAILWLVFIGVMVAIGYGIGTGKFKNKYGDTGF